MRTERNESGDYERAQAGVGLRKLLNPLLREIESLNERIAEYDTADRADRNRSVSRGGSAETGKRSRAIELR